VSQLDTRSTHTAAPLPREFPLKKPEDYAVIEYIYEHTWWEPTYDDYVSYESDIGDDGYLMVVVGDRPFHHFLLRLAGYGHGYYQLADHLPLVEHLMEVMEQVEIERLWPLVLASPARLIRHGVHFSSQMTPPHLFREYILPYYQRAVDPCQGGRL
jgi:hypothetical protein